MNNNNVCNTLFIKTTKRTQQHAYTFMRTCMIHMHDTQCSNAKNIIICKRIWAIHDEDNHLLLLGAAIFVIVVVCSYYSISFNSFFYVTALVCYLIRIIP